MKLQKSRSYTREYRAEAVKMTLEQGLSCAEAARKLGMPEGTLFGWVQAAKGVSVAAVPGARSVYELESEIKRLHKELAQVKLEREILKKATAYFAQESK